MLVHNCVCFVTLLLAIDEKTSFICDMYVIVIEENIKSVQKRGVK